jgi:hypothetical protein
MIRALLQRLSLDMGFRVSISTSIKGGHGGIITEIKGFQRAIRSGGIPSGVPDILIILRDANCGNFNNIKASIVRKLDRTLFPFIVVGCPDPHVERWLFLDSDALINVFGISTQVPSYKCEKDFYKNEFIEIVRRAGWPIIQGGIEYFQDVVKEMNLLRASRNDHSFRNFLSNLKSTLKSLNL